MNKKRNTKVPLEVLVRLGYLSETKERKFMYSLKDSQHIQNAAFILRQSYETKINFGELHSNS